jgi:hypothetical protein
MEPKDHGAPTVIFGKEALEAVSGVVGSEAAYWRMVLEAGPTAVAPNLDTLPGILSTGGGFSPIAVNNSEVDNSYPCSLVTQYVRYPLDELRLLKSRIFQWVARAGLTGLGALLEWGEIDRVVQWNAWLLSTNLLPRLSGGVLKTTTDSLTGRFPRHAVLVKNIHARDDPSLPGLFVQAGYHLIPSRKIYFFDGKDAGFLSRSNVKQDMAALRKLTDYTPVEHHEFQPADVPRIVRLYELLYVEKHSRLNPRYTPFFVQKALEHRFLEFRGLRHSSGRIDAVFACVRRGDVVATPFVGYDTAMIREPGFYRLLVAMLLRRVAEEGTLLNYSSGAGEFKRRRGGEGCLEYNAVYTRHLPMEQKLPFLLLDRCAGYFGGRFLSGSTV